MRQWCRTLWLCSVVSASLLHAQTSIADALAAKRRSVERGTSSSTPVATPATLEAALHGAFQDAGIVFTGEVTAIDREPGSVLVRWQVEQGIQGVSTGSTYTQREWAGLWSGDTGRYVVGQRALVFLHAPSVAGYATPVSDGIIPLHGGAGSSTLDLRWMAQHVAVTDLPRLTPMLALQAANGSFTAAAAIQESTARASAQARALQVTAPEPPPDTPGTEQPSPQAASDPNAHVDGGMVLDMLHAWQRTSGAAQ